MTSVAKFFGGVLIFSSVLVVPFWIILNDRGDVWYTLDFVLFVLGMVLCVNAKDIGWHFYRPEKDSESE